MLKRTVTVAVASFILAACSSNSVKLSEQSVHETLLGDRKPALQVPRGATYVRALPMAEIGDDLVITFHEKKVSIKQALTKPFELGEVKFGVIPQDRGVDLSRKINVRAYKMNIKEYMKLLSQLTGYEIIHNGENINVSSYVIKTWNVSSFADTRVTNHVSAKNQTGVMSGSSTESKTSIALTTGTTDEWTGLIESARKMIGAKNTEDTEDSEGSEDAADLMDEDTVIAQAQLDDLEEALTREPYVHGIRSAGLITAGGNPSNINALDAFFKQANKIARTQFNIQIKAFEVVLGHSKQKGIDWDLLLTGGIGAAFSRVGATEVGGTSLFNLTGTYTSDNKTNTAMIKFLEEYGRVELTSQPNITVRNGVPAQITRGTEFSFVADFTQNIDLSGITTIIPSFARMNVGVTLAVTARLLDDDLILLDIWPTISLISGSDSFNVEGFEFETPVVSLQEFTTQIVAASGQTIQLGGLITKKLIKEIEGVPIRNKKTRELANLVFSDEANSVERSELVMTVTPTIVEGIY